MVAIGNIASDGTINRGYNVASVYIPEEGNPYYGNTLTDIYYDQSTYVTVLTPFDAGYLHLTPTYASGGGKLFVHILFGVGNVTVSDFSFIVPDTSP